MKKQLLFITALMCACVGNVWGIDWVGETPMDENHATSYFYIKSAKTDLFINGDYGTSGIGTLRVDPDLWQVWYDTEKKCKLEGSTYTIIISRGWVDPSTNEYSLNINNSGSINLQHPTTGWINPTYDGPNTTEVTPSDGSSINAWKIHRTAKTARRMKYDGSTGLTTELATATANDYSDWLFISQLQYEYKTAKALVDAYLSSALEENYPDGFLYAPAIALNCSIADAALWNLTSAQKTSFTNYTAMLKAWLGYAEVVRQARAAGYAGEALSVASAMDVTTIENAKKSYCAAAVNHFKSTASDSHEISFVIVNPGFEFSSSDINWDFGWTGTSDATKNGVGDDNAGNQMRAFQKYADGGNTYAWMYRKNDLAYTRTLLAGSVYQKVTLPAGLYKLSANIKEYLTGSPTNLNFKLFVRKADNTSLGELSITNGDNNFYLKTVCFSLTETTDIEIGVQNSSLDGSSMKTIAVDNFKLFIRNDIVNANLANTNSSSNDFGWALTTDNGSWNTTTGAVEVWEGNGTESYAMSQDVYLPAGYYKLTGNAFFRKNDRDNDDGRTSRAVLFAGSSEVPVLPLRRSVSHNSSGGIDGLSAAATALTASPSNYTNSLYFRVASAGVVNLGYNGTFAGNASWFAAGPVSLERLGDSYLQKVTVSSAGWATICLPFPTTIPTGVTAYYVSGIRTHDNGTKSIVLTEITGAIAAYEPLIISASSDDYTFKWDNSGASAIGSDNKLGGTYAPMEFANSEVFVLGYDGDQGVPFFGPLKNGEEAYDILPANKAYLEATFIGEFNDPAPTPTRINFIIENENTTTNIQNVSDNCKAKKIFRNGQVIIMRGNEIFDVMGRKIH